MNSTPAAVRPAPVVRWVAAIGFVCALQIAGIFLLENRSPLPPRDSTAQPRVRARGDAPEEWLALRNPTLFVQPHVRGFSGAIWQPLQPPSFSAGDVSEPVRYLGLPAGQLGVEFKTFLARTAVPAYEPVRWRNPEPDSPRVDWNLPVATRSTLRIEGALARRKLLARPELPVQTSTDLLTNSVVQLLVNGRGKTISATPLGRGSGKTEADTLALKLARQARFEPLPTADDPSADLTLGTLVFEWQTVLVPLPETPAETP